MDAATAVVADLEAMAEVADQGIVSKSIVENDHHKIIHFTLAPRAGAERAHGQRAGRHPHPARGR